jgi:hypothetical protein
MRKKGPYNTANMILRSAGINDKAWMKFLRPWILVSLIFFVGNGFFSPPEFIIPTSIFKR